MGEYSGKKDEEKILDIDKIWKRGPLQYCPIENYVPPTTPQVENWFRGLRGCTHEWGSPVTNGQ